MSIETPIWDTPELEQFWPDGHVRIILDETDSTMAEVRRRRPDLRGPTWIMARRQTAATGRRGRAWVAPEGNFAATLFLPLQQEVPQQAALRSFVASLALMRTLAMVVAPPRLTLKWPNDVLLDGGKVAGILLESGGQTGHVDWLSIGIGVNLVTAPDASQVEDGAFMPVALMAPGGIQTSAEEILFWLANHYAGYERLFREFGFDPIRRLWLRHAARLGETITARTMHESHSGVFETVDEEGQLLLQTADGPRRIPAGDVFFGEPKCS
ncbi:MAG: biotin--[acetyl-CoA-carboxylase] ligase [Jannaschia sp.]